MPDKTKACHCCDGTGQETDNVKLGRALSGLRLRKQITLRAFARELGISHTYLWQLENGKRNWPAHLLKNYREAL
jgi:transcriptional regulator with XRE-family HTH domain